jgi:L-aspartate oxidase
VDDPFPLARMIARSALAREESRGAHQRRDHPATESALDGMHSVVSGDDPPRFDAWS